MKINIGITTEWQESIINKLTVNLPIYYVTSFNDLKRIFYKTI